MAFTSWTALRTAILDALADGSILTGSYTIQGRTHTFRTFKEVSEMIQFCDMQIAAGNGGPLMSYAQFDRPNEGIE